MQHEITNRHPLLDEKGYLIEPGYTKGLLMDYDRSKIKAGKFRIKEWDYYLITMEDKFALALTVADNSYMGLCSISLLDFENNSEQTTSPMMIMPMGRLNLPPSSDTGDIIADSKNYHIYFRHNGSYRLLSFNMENFKDGKSIKGEIRLENVKQDSMVIVTPFKEKKTAFYYNQKILAMPASGSVTFNDRVYNFETGKAFGLLDWGRGVWTYDNTWYWGAAQGMLDKHRFAWNIGYGFGDTKAASENMLFYDGIAHKLGRIKFNIPKKAGNKNDFMIDWTITSDDGRFEMEFKPILDRAAKTDIKILCSDQHQVFGYFSGTATLDDGQVLEVKDFFGFAEKVRNKW